MRRTTFRTTAVTGAAAAALAAVAAAAGGASAATHPSTARAAIPDSTPHWLGHAKAGAASQPGTAQSVTLRLAPKGGTASLAAAVAAVSTPGSASYRHFLTPAQYFARFAPTSAAVGSAKTWLTDAGLTVTAVDAQHGTITATGTRARLGKAFGVNLRSYTHDGQAVTAPDGPTFVPAGLAGTVLAVDGLDTTQAIVKKSSAPAAKPPAAFRNGRPCSTYYGQIEATYQADYKTKLPKFEGETLPYAPCGYTGPQLRAAYEGPLAGTVDGAGVTVGIIDAYAAPTIAQDASTYATNHGDEGYARGQLTQTQLTPFAYGNKCGGESGWWGEETLDVEAVHAMAGGADIHYYGASSCFDDDIRTAQQKLVDDDDVDIVSNSYGEPDAVSTQASVVADTAVFRQAAMEGISFVFSSGDDGDELANTGLKQSDSSASNPYVTAVGGTSTAIGASGAIEFQTGWGTDKFSLSANGKKWVPVGYLYGAGGGYSSLYNRPSYQEGVVPKSAPAGRAVPDVAMDADPTTGMLVGETQLNPGGKVAYGEYRIGGTSLASPLFAGLTALKLEVGGKRLGFLNPKIYGSTTAFADVKGTPPDAGNVRVDYANGFDATDGLLYSVRTFNQDSSLAVAKGWDDVTGVGVPKPSWVISR